MYLKFEFKFNVRHWCHYLFDDWH